MKSPTELNSLFSKIFCYIIRLDATLDHLQTRALRQSVLFPQNNSLAISKLETVYIDQKAKIFICKQLNSWYKHLPVKIKEHHYDGKNVKVPLETPMGSLRVKLSIISEL